MTSFDEQVECLALDRRVQARQVAAEDEQPVLAEGRGVRADLLGDLLRGPDDRAAPHVVRARGIVRAREPAPSDPVALPMSAYFQFM